MITGAGGTGTTTLARAIATAWSAPHADADDYYWLPTDPPYMSPREPAERQALMEQVFAPREAWVLSGTMMTWGERVVARCQAVVFLTLDPEVRMARLVERERVRYGQDPVAGSAEFLQWCRGYDDPDFAGRSRARHEAFLATLGVPVLRLDSDRPVQELATAVLGVG